MIILLVIRGDIHFMQLCHWVGCFWQLIADVGPKVFGYDVSWKIADRDSDFLHMVYDGGLHGFSAYRRGIYWYVSIHQNFLMLMCCWVMQGD